MDRQINLSLAEFNAIYNLPVRGEQRQPSAFKPEEFWHALTRQTSYDATRSKSSAIINPCFRYLHRVLAHTLFGRGDSEGVVRRSELFVMWAMVNDFSIDTGSLLARQFSKIANSNVGAIVLGGFGIPLQGLEEAKGKNRVDLATCQAMKMVARIGDHYHLILPEPQPPLPLPNPARLTIQIRDNWWLQAPPNGDEPDGRLDPPPPVSSPTARSSHGPRPHPSTVDTLQQILDQQQQLLDRQTQLQGTVDNMVQVVQRMHDWFVSPTIGSSRGPRPHPSTADTLHQILDQQQQLLDRQTQLQGTIDNMVQVLQCMHDWFVTQGHFPPPQ
ncbi:UNVERIFIED_CONTAM: hypothetical protein Slati_3851700 [Sesamum latifolium]|uniref:Arabidopsis retrotransposon Orf1 C-terminal domain-containing protein n=1 Tax=Sesamum latifolium TaxID=2727402 RepID=A0AAW2TMD8_9LAMI